MATKKITKKNSKSTVKKTKTTKNKAAKKSTAKKAKTTKKTANKAKKAKKVAKKTVTKPKTVTKAKTTKKVVSSSVKIKKKIIEKPELKIKTYHLRKPIPEAKYFVFVNGHRVKNVKELAEVMDKIEHEVFAHHVNPDRNDFYNWVKDVFDDVELAEKLLGVKDPKHLQLEIFKHITNKAFED